MILIIGFTCPPTIHFKVIKKCDKCYYKVRQLILLQSAIAFLLQSATIISKCDRTKLCTKDKAHFMIHKVAFIQKYTDTIVQKVQISNLSFFFRLKVKLLLVKM